MSTIWPIPCAAHGCPEEGTVRLDGRLWCDWCAEKVPEAGREVRARGPRALVARFPGRCRACSGEIKPGDFIWWSKRAGPEHANCEAPR